MVSIELGQLLVQSWYSCQNPNLSDFQLYFMDSDESYMVYIWYEWKDKDISRTEKYK